MQDAWPSTLADQRTITELREFSRKLVRELGFMRSSLFDSHLAPSAIHALIEIGLQPGLPARDLATLLRLDKSNTSRQLAKLESLGLLWRSASEDGRSAQLHLTDSGCDLRDEIDRLATAQVASALQHLRPIDRLALIRSLSLYVDALARDSDGLDSRKIAPAASGIHEGYLPGCIGDIASLHGRYYAQLAGFGVYFEKRVATELAAFAERLPCADKALWLYVEGDRTLASLAIDGDTLHSRAHLRWFIVDDALQGSGIGRQLLALAMDFVDERFAETYLHTFKGLDAARHLYEAFGFRLTDEEAGQQWGQTVIEQRFSRMARASGV